MPVQRDGPVDLQIDQVLGKRWKIINKLGEGGCGSVYQVEDIKTKAKAALKAESNFVVGGSVLKVEVEILKRLNGRRHVPQLLHSGKRTGFSYMVMTLLGESLETLRRQCSRECSVSTQIRVGINILYGLKQLHEIGYVHRDIKPANLARGRRGAETRFIHLLDFGLARQYVSREGDKVQIRRPRSGTLFRGTMRYCSAMSHTRSEQGRPDDLWSMIYVLAEMRGSLPWSHLREKHEIGKIKQLTPDARLLQNSPTQLTEIAAHLRTLTYSIRPDYFFIFSKFCEVKNKANISYDDPYDWDLSVSGTIVNSLKRKFSSAKKSHEKPINEKPINEQGPPICKSSKYSVPQKSEQIEAVEKTFESSSETEKPNGGFCAADFVANELGF